MLMYKKIDYLCDINNITRKEMCEKTGISYATLNSMIARQSKNISLDTIRLIADFFNTSLDYLIVDEISDINHGKCDTVQLNQEEQELIHKYRELEEHGKEAIDGLLGIEYNYVKDKYITIDYYTLETNKENREDDFITIDYYEQGAAAGTGVTLTDEVKQSAKVPKSMNGMPFDYAVSVNGDSMLPAYQHGDLLLIKDVEELKNNDVGVFILNGEGYLKQLYCKDGQAKLLSFNNQYNPIDICENDSLISVGKVIGKVPANNWEQINL